MTSPTSRFWGSATFDGPYWKANSPPFAGSGPSPWKADDPPRSASEPLSGCSGATSGSRALRSRSAMKFLGAGSWVGVDFGGWGGGWGWGFGGVGGDRKKGSAGAWLTLKGGGAKIEKKQLAARWGFQPLNYNKQTCIFFPNNNHGWGRGKGVGLRDVDFGGWGAWRKVRALGCGFRRVGRAGGRFEFGFGFGLERTVETAQGTIGCTK